MTSKLLIHVGSTSAHKIAAVRRACEELGLDAEIVGLKATSGVNEQPEGLAETRLGARNRAERAWLDGPRTPDVALGIENGIVSADATITADRPNESAPIFDLAFVVARAPTGTRFHAMSAGHEIDPEDVEEARSRGFDEHTVGSVTAERTGCEATDQVPYYTGGRATRAELLRQAVMLTLAQWLAWRDRFIGTAANTEQTKT